MAEDPIFSGFSSGDAASTFASTISQIKSDMEAIERSAKNIQQSLEKAAKARLGGGGGGFGAQNAGGKTGYSKDQGMSLGDISTPSSLGRVGAFAFGTVIGGGLSGGIATAGFGDLRVTPNRAADFEAARFGVRQATGSFGSFQNIIDSAKTDFNVQNERDFYNTIVHATQRMGMTGLMGGGTVGEQKTGQLVGGFSSLAALAGLDQSTVNGTMNAMYGAQSYYASMAAGIQTRNPVTGEPVSAESMVNQLWRNTGMGNMSGEAALTAINRDYAIGSAGRAQLEQMYGGDQGAIQTVIEGMRLRAQSGGALKEGAIEDQAREAGILGTEDSQNMEAERALQASNVAQTAEYTNDVTAGMKDAAERIKGAVDLLTELDGPMREFVGAAHTFAAEMDVFQTKVPGMTSGLTDFFGSLPSFLMGLILGKGKGGLNLMDLLTTKGGKGKLLSRGASILGKAALPVGIAATGIGVTEGIENMTGAGERNWNGFDWAGTTAGYAATGAVVGSVIPGVGTAVGAGVGTLVGLIRSAVRESQDSQYENKGEGKAEGDWNVSEDMDVRIHQGEMVLPSRVATAVRRELGVGQEISSDTLPSNARSGSTNVNIYLTLQRTTDQEAYLFAARIKRILDRDDELVSVGSGSFG